MKPFRYHIEKSDSESWRIRDLRDNHILVGNFTSREQAQLWLTKYRDEKRGHPAHGEWAGPFRY